MGSEKENPLCITVLHSIYDVLNNILTQLLGEYDPTLVSLVSHLLYMAEVSNFSIASLEAYIPHSIVTPDQSNHNRTKRGLFDLAGMFLGTVFGLATQSDVQHVSEAMATLTNGITHNAIVLAQQNSVLKKLIEHHNVFVASLNLIESTLSNLKHTNIIMVKLLQITMQLQGLQHSVTNLNTVVKSRFQMILSASSGIVSTTLIEPSQLSDIIWAHLTKRLSPLFPSSSVQLYYPSLDATLTSPYIYTHIPFKALGTFNAFRILPFPITINDSFHAISLPDTLTLIFGDFQHIVLPSPDFLTLCHS